MATPPVRIPRGRELWIDAPVEDLVILGELLPILSIERHVDVIGVLLELFVIGVVQPEQPGGAVHHD
jgi:hypothetical protein